MGHCPVVPFWPFAPQPAHPMLHWSCCCLTQTDQEPAQMSDSFDLWWVTPCDTAKKVMVRWFSPCFSCYCIASLGPTTETEHLWKWLATIHQQCQTAYGCKHGSWISKQHNYVVENVCFHKRRTELKQLSCLGCKSPLRITSRMTQACNSNCENLKVSLSLTIWPYKSVLK